MQYVRRSRITTHANFSGRDGCRRSAFVSVLRGSKGVADSSPRLSTRAGDLRTRYGSCNASRARRGCRGTRLAACNADPAFEQ